MFVVTPNKWKTKTEEANRLQKQRTANTVGMKLMNLKRIFVARVPSATPPHHCCPIPWFQNSKQLGIWWNSHSHRRNFEKKEFLIQIPCFVALNRFAVPAELPCLDSNISAVEMRHRGELRFKWSGYIILCVPKPCQISQLGPNF